MHRAPFSPLGNFEPQDTVALADCVYNIQSDVLKALGIEPSKRKTIVYCRVSSRGQISDLKSQDEAMRLFCLGGGIAVDEWVSEVGGGMNFKRKKFLTSMSDIGTGRISKLIVAHKARLARFGFDYNEIVRVAE